MLTKHLGGGFEIKAISEDGSFSGHGSVFGVVDAYGDSIQPGAFARTLKEWDQRGKRPKLLLQHDPSQIVGKWTAMREDARGLYVEGQLFIDLPLARATWTLMKEGQLDGLSIGFSLPKAGTEFDATTKVNRIKDVDLWEVSIVTFPANTAATVEAVKAALGNPREFERQLRDVLGLTQSEAKKLMAEGYKAVAPRDVSANASVEVATEEKASQLIEALRAMKGN